MNEEGGSIGSGAECATFDGEARMVEENTSEVGRTPAGESESLRAAGY